jgi:anthranilate phosphoribosyltransferase
MKFVGAARSSLGIPTLFNLLGPLTNPAKARHQLLGVFAPELTERMAAVLRELGSERAWVVHANDGLDEISTMGPTRISELANRHIHTWELDPKDFGVPYATLSDLQVNSVDEAADALREVLAGVKGPKRDIAVLNAAIAILIAGEAFSIDDGIGMASQAIDCGKAERALASIIAISNSE